MYQVDYKRQDGTVKSFGIINTPIDLEVSKEIKAYCKENKIALNLLIESFSRQLLAGEIGLELVRNQKTKKAEEVKIVSEPGVHERIVEQERQPEENKKATAIGEVKGRKKKRQGL